MKIKALIILAIFCTNLFSFSIFERAEISKLKEQIEKDYTNIQLHIELAKEYDKDFAKSKNVSDLKKVFEELQIAYSLNSKDLQIIAMNYNVGVGLAKMTRDEKTLNKLQPLFHTLSNANLNAEPISYIRSSIRKYDINDKQNIKEHIKLIKLAIKENKRYYLNYYVLASLYIDLEKYDLALHMVNTGIKLEANFPKFYLLKAQTIMRKIENKDKNSKCNIFDKEDNKKIVENLKKAIKLNKNPNDIEAKLELSTTYNRMGKNNLSIFISKQLYKNTPNDITRLNLVYNYLESLQLEEANKLIKNYSVNNSYFELDKIAAQGRIAFLKEDWKNANDYLEKIIDSKQYTNFYTYVNFGITQKALNKKDAFKILDNLPKKITMTTWKFKIKDYLQEKITEEEFLSHASDICKKTEAYFYVGENALLNNNIPKARKYFKETTKYKAYSYKEYLTAKYLLTIY